MVWNEATVDVHLRFSWEHGLPLVSRDVYSGTAGLEGEGLGAPWEGPAVLGAPTAPPHTQQALTSTTEAPALGIAEQRHSNRTSVLSSCFSEMVTSTFFRCRITSFH